MLFQVGRAVPTTPWELVLTSSRETKFVLAILVVFSIVSWYLIFLKWWQFRRMRQLGDRFLAEVEKAPRLDDAYHAAMRLPPSPYNRLLREGIHFFSELRGFSRGFQVAWHMQRRLKNAPARDSSDGSFAQNDFQTGPAWALKSSRTHSKKGVFQ